MTEANAEQTRVTSLTVERLFNLGNYENVKYGVRVEIAQGDNPGRVLASLENILNDLHASSGVSSYTLEKAKRETPELEAKGDALEGYERDKLDDYRSYVQRDEDARERRRKSREALATLNYTSQRKDHKEDWVDDNDLVHPDDRGEIEF